MTRTVLFVLLLIVWLPCVMGQSGLSFDLKKPPKYENKKLGSEKTEDKKWTLPRRFVQNGVTKFNFNFNAQAKLNEVLARAKAAHKDDYTQLLSFYNYSLEKTAQEKQELDSVILKANTGILIHDLRNTWDDNLFMLMGQAFYYENDLDTAYLTFQYINYAFSPKEKDGYDKPIGSNANEGGNAFSISTKEKKGLFHKVWSRPPSRNESFIWQIRVYLARDEMPEAAGLIETLRHDPEFPKRLHPELDQVRSLWFYKQEMYDSAAVYLEKALGTADSREEHARWEYLIAQMYERAHKPELSSEFYQRVVNHTLDPVLEVYARLYSIRQNKKDEKAIQDNIDALVKMARKEKYQNYRDIIYYMAAQIELERNNIAGAKTFLLKAARYSTDNVNKSKAFAKLAELSFNERKYAEAKNYYDSVTNNDGTIISNELLTQRKTVLTTIVEELAVIDRQDSLQRIAQMPEAERDAFVKKMVKQLKKAQGVQEDELTASGNNGNITNNDKPADLFNSPSQGEWYFNNPSAKSKGYSEFKGKWGNRPNVDNWQRIAAVQQAINVQQQQNDRSFTGGKTVGAIDGGGISYEALMKKLPLTPRQMQASNDSIETAKLLLGKAYLEGLEDYPQAAAVLEDFLDQFSYSAQRPQALFYLYYCYIQMGDKTKAAQVALDLHKRYPDSEFDKKVLSASGKSQSIDSAKVDMNNRYDSIYNLFIEGNFQEALAQKKIADSLYSTNYWTPQLLYIQSVYYIRQRMDDSAKKVLQSIITLYPSSPLVARAKTMIDVLGRRKQIEDYLTKLEIKRPDEDSTKNNQQPVTSNQQIVTNNQQPIKKDSGQIKPAVTNNQPPPANNQQLVKKDSSQLKPPVPVKYAYSSDTSGPHLVAVVLDKVDPVYITEAKNAFNRYNKQTYYNKVIDINNVPVNNDITLVVMNNFESASVAYDYVNKTRKIAAGEIIPWMPAGKFTFIIITVQNLEILKNAKDINAYKQFLAQTFPGKF